MFSSSGAKFHTKNISSYPIYTNIMISSTFLVILWDLANAWSTLIHSRPKICGRTIIGVCLRPRILFHCAQDTDICEIASKRLVKMTSILSSRNNLIVVVAVEAYPPFMQCSNKGCRKVLYPYSDTDFTRWLQHKKVKCEEMHCGVCGHLLLCQIVLNI